MEKADGTKWEFSYNSDGLRTQRTNGTTTYNYVYNGSQLAQMTVGSDTLRFAYDAAGIPLTVTWNGTVYYYLTNLQGDILAIVDSNGTNVVSYLYDAWGNPGTTGGTLASTLGVLNPLRYRGYVYDTETGLYYLQSRYYDPIMCRFINADGYASTGGVLGTNMYTYCLNNPIMMGDPHGQFPWFIVICGVAVSGIVACCVFADAVNKSGANEAEKDLIYQDPLAAYQVYEAKKLTEEYIDKYYGAEFDCDGTQVNAFRHAMWNAIMTDKIGVEKARKFANAHEQIPNNPPEHLKMDLHNNALGRKIAVQYAGQGYDVFAEKIIEAINNGEAEVLKWDTRVS